jgi:hypothetical protein
MLKALPGPISYCAINSTYEEFSARSAHKTAVLAATAEQGPYKKPVLIVAAGRIRAADDLITITLFTPGRAKLGDSNIGGTAFVIVGHDKISCFRKFFQ